MDIGVVVVEVYMRLFLKTFFVVVVIGYYTGCAKKKFSLDEGKIAESCSAALGCFHQNGTDFYNYSITATGGQVDILFVDDNSGSMSFEQRNMATKFLNFIKQLEDRSIDYRIGITTTDIGSENNGNLSGNTKLVQFGNGATYLTPSSGSSQADRVVLFANAIQRRETQTCEAFIASKVASGASVYEDSSEYKANCPSGDERGIYAASNVVTNNPDSFIRAKSNLAIVILADEDVRSSNYRKGTSNTYLLDKKDLPSELILTVKAKFPDKTTVIHSIIVGPGQYNIGFDQVEKMLKDFTIAPLIESDYSDYKNPSYTSFFSGGDSNCLSAQSSQIPGASFSGSYGYLYAVASRMTGGIEGDICASDYGNQLSSIGANIADRIQEISLRCNNISGLTLSFSPSSAGVSYSLEGTVLKFNQPLTVGTRVDLSYSCPSVF